MESCQQNSASPSEAKIDVDVEEQSSMVLTDSAVQLPDGGLKSKKNKRKNSSTVRKISYEKRRCTFQISDTQPQQTVYPAVFDSVPVMGTSTETVSESFSDMSYQSELLAHNSQADPLKQQHQDVSVVVKCEPVSEDETDTFLNSRPAGDTVSAVSYTDSSLDKTGAAHATTGTMKSGLIVKLKPFVNSVKEGECSSEYVPQKVGRDASLVDVNAKDVECKSEMPSSEDNDVGPSGNDDEEDIPLPVHFAASSKKLGRPRKFPGVTSFACPQCTAVYPKHSSLVQHLRTHSGEKPFVCDVCQQSFARKTCLKQHQNVHSREKMFKCNQCQSAFSRKHHLQTHQRLHSMEKPYPCTECDAAFRQSAHLKRHMQVHSGEKPFSCNVCSISFADNLTLKTHMIKQHSMETPALPYPCLQCGSSFMKSSQLKSHLRIHSNERPFPCDMCGIHFRTAAHLKAHIKVHYSRDKSYSCTECNLIFTAASKLRMHILYTHSDDKSHLSASGTSAPVS